MVGRYWVTREGMASQGGWLCRAAERIEYSSSGYACCALEGTSGGAAYRGIFAGRGLLSMNRRMAEDGGGWWMGGWRVV